jgi:hypothetical protein
MSRLATLIFTMLGAVLLAACQTGTPSGNADSSSTALVPSGYFVALPATGGAPEASKLFRGLYAAVDAFNRKQAEAQGTSQAYAAAFAADGKTRLSDGASEIECDREKCLVKLQARSVRSVGAAGLAGQLTTALALRGASSKRGRSSDAERHSYVLGHRGLGVACVVHGHGDGAFYRCDFDLERGRAPTVATSAALAAAGRGKLVNCEEAPGVERTALSEVDGVEGGGLLKLAGGTGEGAHPVGYLRYAQQGTRVEFLDLYLCGDLSRDYFRIEGRARQPRAWLAGAVDGLEEEDARLAATAKVVGESPQEVTVEVQFHIGRDGASAGGGDEEYGADRFYLRLAKAWMR